MKRKAKRRRFGGPIHTRIATLREAKLNADGEKLTQEQLAKALGVDKTLVSHWETGLGRPQLEHLQPLAAALDTTVAQLIEGEPTYAALGQMLEARAS